MLKNRIFKVSVIVGFSVSLLANIILVQAVKTLKKDAEIIQNLRGIPSDANLELLDMLEKIGGIK